MLLLPNLLVLVVVCISSWPILHASAHSTHAPLLKRAVSPRTLGIEVFPRDGQSGQPPNLLSKRSSSLPQPSSLRFDDSLRLTISAFDELFYLHLRPNDNLVHPDAKIKYYTLDSQGQSVLDRVEPLLRENVRVYEGQVIHPTHTDMRMREDIVGVIQPPDNEAEIGWARIMFTEDREGTNSVSPTYQGAFSVNGVVYHISTKENYLKLKQELDPDVMEASEMDNGLVIWRDSDAMTLEEEHFVKTGVPVTEPLAVPHTCGHDALDFNKDPSLNPLLRPKPPTWLKVLLTKPSEMPSHSRMRRQDVPTGGDGMKANFADFIGQTAGCPETQKVIYMGVAADCEYVAKQGGQREATEQILSTWNTASGLFKSAIRVSLGIVELAVQARVCPTNPGAETFNIPCSPSIDLLQRLSIFSEWRGRREDDGIGLWHLMSACPTGSEVGIAWLGTICRSSSSTTRGNFVSGTAVSTSGRAEWQVVAHEIGHNFGAVHDCSDSCSQGDVTCCPLTPNTCNSEGRFIMSPVAQDGERVFSPCTLGNICSLMSGVAGNPTTTTCLVDPDPTRQLIGENMCGNGIVDGDEQCDPGIGTESTCCDPSTCRFRPNAVCDPANDACCTQTCAFAPASTICRASKHPTCDMAEMCTGTSAKCPADSTAPNGQSCGDDDLKCASGWCTSVAAQCKMVGATLNLKEACPDKSDRTCQIKCKDPKIENGCIKLTTFVIEGSPCGYGGTCSKGVCQSGSFIDTAKAWYVANLQIAIPVTIVAGIIFLLICWSIFSCIRRCCNRGSSHVVRPPLAAAAAMVPHRRMPRTPSTPYRNVPPAPRSQYMRVPPATHERPRSQGGAFNQNANNYANWVDDAPYNGAGGGNQGQAWR